MVAARSPDHLNGMLSRLKLLQASDQHATKVRSGQLATARRESDSSFLTRTILLTTGRFRTFARIEPTFETLSTRRK